MPLLTVNEVITGARDAHPTFDPKRHPPQLLLRELSAYHRRLVAKAAFSSAPAISVSFDTALPLVDFDAGIAIPDYIIVDGATATDASQPPVHSKLALLPWEKRDSASVPFPSGYIYGSVTNNVRTDKLFLLGQSMHWLRYTKITISYVPSPTDLKAGDTMILPQTAYDAVASHLEAFMAKRGAGQAGVPLPDPVAAQMRATTAEETFILELASRRRAVTSIITELF